MVRGVLRWFDLTSSAHPLLAKGAVGSDCQSLASVGTALGRGWLGAGGHSWAGSGSQVEIPVEAPVALSLFVWKSCVFFLCCFLLVPSLSR